MPIKYECTVMHIALASIDAVMDRHLRPDTKEYSAVAEQQEDAIKIISRIRTGKQLGAVTLEEVRGDPFVVVVKSPDRICIVDLDTDERWTYTFPGIPEYAERVRTATFYLPVSFSPYCTSPGHFNSQCSDLTVTGENFRRVWVKIVGQFW